MREHFGSEHVVARGRILDTSTLPGLIALRDGTRVGFLHYLLGGAECEVVSLVSTVPRTGVGRILLDALGDFAASRGANRLVLVTTNDNVSAQRLYEACGFEHSATRAGAISRARQLKPEIPLVGQGGTAIEDELEYQRRLVHT